MLAGHPTAPGLRRLKPLPRHLSPGLDALPDRVGANPSSLPARIFPPGTSARRRRPGPPISTGTRAAGAQPTGARSQAGWRQKHVALAHRWGCCTAAACGERHQTSQRVMSALVRADRRSSGRALSLDGAAICSDYGGPRRRWFWPTASTPAGRACKGMCIARGRGDKHTAQRGLVRPFAEVAPATHVVTVHLSVVRPCGRQYHETLRALRFHVRRPGGL